MAPNPTRYANDPVWSDVTPIPQDDGGPNALATIAYTDEYREASEYLRASMAANEYSERALNLTAHLIELNPAHYTVWWVATNEQRRRNSMLTKFQAVSCEHTASSTKRHTHRD